MKSPTEMLEAEHRVIARIVGITPVLAQRLEEGDVIKPEILKSIVEFMRIYADKCHHGKEEDLLFPALSDKGVPMQGCPIGALVADHVREGRWSGISPILPKHMQGTSPKHTKD